MEGFFTKKELSNAKNPFLGCISCGLYKNCNSPKMRPYGNFRKGIMIIGDYPGESDDQYNIPWRGRSGRILKKVLRGLGIDLYEDCVCVNAINCRPTTVNQIKPDKIKSCYKEILKPAIDEYQPDVIILLGPIALRSVIGSRWKKKLGEFKRWRGWQIPDRDYKTWICPVFHPTFVIQRDSKETITFWKRDLQNAVNLANKRLPHYIKPKIKLIKDLRSLYKIKKADLGAFDYEATGLKPHKNVHEIKCAALSFDGIVGYTFELPKKLSERKPFIELLADMSIGWIASNLKYEDTWTEILLGKGAHVGRWVWDTMLAAHNLDNRKGVSGLKFQVYVNFGIIDYDNEVESYLKADNANDLNKLNTIMSYDEGKKMILKYCGLDAIYEYRLAMLQMEKFKWDFIYV